MSSGSAPINPDGVNLISTVARDITQRHQAEKEKERLMEELLQSRKMESVGRLAGGIAHDFNNMMQVVLGNTILVLELCPRESVLHPHLKEIETSANRSADLTRHLLIFARKQQIQPRTLDLGSVWSDRRARHRATFLTKAVYSRGTHPHGPRITRPHPGMTSPAPSVGAIRAGGFQVRRSSSALPCLPVSG